MSLEGAYDPQNIFAKIIKGEIPSIKVHETDSVLSFMDLFPQSRGHLLVIPKNAQARNLLDMPAGELQKVIVEAQRIAKAMVKALDCDGIQQMQFNGAEAGQTGGLPAKGRNDSSSLAKEQSLQKVGTSSNQSNDFSSGLKECLSL